MSEPLSIEVRFQVQCKETRDLDWWDRGPSHRLLEFAKKYANDRKARGMKFRIVESRTTRTVVE